MAKRKIYKLPKYEKLLRKRSAPVKKVTRQVRALVDDLMETLGSVSGVGLAAPQVGVLSRVAVVLVGTDQPEGSQRQPVILPLIDPEIVEQEGADRGYDGCLSIPGLQGYTRRPTRLRVRSLDLAGNRVEYLFEGFDARVAAHELDHLDGILYFDRLETLEDLFYLVPDEEDEDKVRFLPYLDVHPELRRTPELREGIPTRGVPTIADEPEHARA